LKPVSQNFYRLAFFLLMTLTAGILISCDTNIPTPPQVTVNITMVSNENALGEAVNAALTGTAVQNVYATETALERGGITLTPTSTPTFTLTPRPPTATRVLSPTPSDTPTITPTPTFVPFVQNTPSAFESRSQGGRIRVVNAWQDTKFSTVDIFVEDLAVGRTVAVGEATSYQRVLSPTVRVSIYGVDEPGQDTSIFPIVNRVIEVPDGGGVTVVLGDFGEGPALLPVPEDVTPLDTGYARVTVVQANRRMLRSNLAISELQRALVYDLEVGEIAGPFDIPSGEYPVAIYDADNPSLLLDLINPYGFNNRLNYLLVFFPPPPDNDNFETIAYQIFDGGTSRTPTDLAAYFVNAASTTGSLTVLLDGQVQVRALGVGSVLGPVPVSKLGNSIVVEDQNGRETYTADAPLWGMGDSETDKIIILFDRVPSELLPDTVQIAVFSRNPRPSVVGSNVRLIHALTGTTVTLDLQIRSTNPSIINNPFGVPPSQQGNTAWSPMIQNVSFGTPSDYVNRTPNVFDVRLALSGTDSVQASLAGLQFLAGGVYDFVALPGDRGGVAKLVLIEPDVQVSTLGINQADPQVIQQQVEAALTASAPAVSVTPTVARTPTPTISPVPTNTPPPSNTPGVGIPSLLVNPAPPNAIIDTFVLVGEDFAVDRRYTINIDGGAEVQSGNTDEQGGFQTTITLPNNIAPGLHVVRVCVDCRVSGAQQEQLIAIKVADPDVTPTATPQP
jgi:Domain of unknown function (DUF4397)